VEYFWNCFSRIGSQW